MNTQSNHIFFPVSFLELFSAWNHFPQAVIYAGGTDLLRIQRKNIINLPEAILCLDMLEDLHRITRTEHYIEIGSMATLNRLIRIGKIVPEILCTCLKNIGGIQLRNTATIGGNICSSSCLYDLSAPLTALDAQYELRTSSNTRWVSSSRFHSTEDTGLNKQEILTRIRLPLHQWDYSVYKKISSEDLYNYELLIFLARAKKNVLTDIRVVYKSNTILRNKTAEDIICGKYLPLNRKTSNDFIENWKDYLSNRQELSNFSKNNLMSKIEDNIHYLSE